ncbi:MAG: hypothetical protein A3C36_06645 [Omnitrophica WOR_2 bacterium RIFCSPHIGHO2_02_FULL_52_10]|nr:MAG: hypothetical protein A3C36_06645 [Omnitrophica WOR_2 bacterium RIFCSPHIGHO2_02_FULL_52_10]
MNSSGKVLVIFLVITAILLISLTAISLFFFQKETERRKLAETTLEEFQGDKAVLEKEFEELKKQNFLMEEKKKEADDRLNDLSDELELEKGLREEIKLEAASLQEKLNEAQKSKEELSQSFKEKEKAAVDLKSELAKYGKEIKELKFQLNTEMERNKKFSEAHEQTTKEQQEEISRLKNLQTKGSVYVPEHIGAGPGEEEASQVVSLGVELDEIVVNPHAVGAEEDTLHSTASVPLDMTVNTLDSFVEGRILSVDVETEFVIVSLGENDGLSVGNVLSVYRNNDYLGDIKVTRLQPKMSAADLITPLSIRNVQKNDQVKVKQ